MTHIVNATATQTIPWNGHNWRLADLEDHRWSLVCLDPVIDHEGHDQTRWPSDEIISGWIGKPVVFKCEGDHTEYLEGIFELELIQGHMEGHTG